MKNLLVGLDIGGVNIKCSSFSPSSDKSFEKHSFSSKNYFPLWKNTLPDLEHEIGIILKNHIRHWLELAEKNEFQVATCASITGELSDAFSSKKEGIFTITGALARAIENLEVVQATLRFKKPLIISTHGKLLGLNEANKSYRDVSAANWFATSKWMGNYIEHGLLIDCGSTTTDIIPIINHEPKTVGKTDLERLVSGELVYTGVLRATIPSISHVVPVGGKEVPISFEKFALVADLHLILGNITGKQYECETADGRSTSIDDSKRRLARIVCEDADFLGDDAILNIARYLHDKQIIMVKDAISKVLKAIERLHDIKREEVTCFVTGLGENVLARPAAELAGLKHVKNLSSMLDFDSSVVSSSLGALFMLKKIHDDEGNGTG